jgi:hypothetical protein
MTDAEEIAHHLEFIKRNWPSIPSLIPHDAIPRLDINIFSLRTHSRGPLAWWLHSRGGKHFVMQADHPWDSFFLLALQGRSNSEHLFLMWLRERRRFWFHHAYMRVYGSGDSLQRSTKALELVLSRWNTTNNDIAYSGDWGWLDPETGRFDQDLVLHGPEDWER